MKTLIIHPQDDTTSFLRFAVSGIFEGAKYVDKPPHDKLLRKMIAEHDTIIMMGHGTDAGLLSPSWAFNKPYVINDSYADLLREKDCVFIWCNADQYVKRNNLSGFYTGMIISEPDEAMMFLGDRSPKYVSASNKYISYALRCGFEEPREKMLERVIREYHHYAKTNAVIQYNIRNMFYKKRELPVPKVNDGRLFSEDK